MATVKIGGKTYRVTNPPKSKTKTSSSPYVTIGGKTYLKSEYRTPSSQIITPSSPIKPTQAVDSGRKTADGKPILVPYRTTEAYRVATQPRNIISNLPTNIHQQARQTGLTDSEIKQIVEQRGEKAITSIINKYERGQAGYYRDKQRRFTQEQSRRAETPADALRLLQQQRIAPPSRALQEKVIRDQQREDILEAKRVPRATAQTKEQAGAMLRGVTETSPAVERKLESLRIKDLPYMSVRQSMDFRNMLANKRIREQLERATNVGSYKTLTGDTRVVRVNENNQIVYYTYKKDGTTLKKTGSVSLQALRVSNNRLQQFVKQAGGIRPYARQIVVRGVWGGFVKPLATTALKVVFAQPINMAGLSVKAVESALGQAVTGKLSKQNQAKLQKFNTKVKELQRKAKLTKDEIKLIAFIGALTAVALTGGILAGAGGIVGAIGKGIGIGVSAVGKGIVIGSGWEALKEPSPQNVGRFLGLVSIGALFKSLKKKTPKDNIKIQNSMGKLRKKIIDKENRLLTRKGWTNRQLSKEIKQLNKMREAYGRLDATMKGVPSTTKVQFRRLLRGGKQKASRIGQNIKDMKVWKNKRASFRGGKSIPKKPLRSKKPMSKAQLRERKGSPNVTRDTQTGELVLRGRRSGFIRESVRLLPTKQGIGVSLVRKSPLIKQIERIDPASLRRDITIIPTRTQVKIATSLTGKATLPTLKKVTMRDSKLYPKGYTSQSITSLINKPANNQMLQLISKQAGISVTQTKNTLGYLSIAKRIKQTTKQVIKQDLSRLKSDLDKGLVTIKNNKLQFTQKANVQQAQQIKGFRAGKSTQRLIERLRLLKEQRAKQLNQKTPTQKPVPIAKESGRSVVLYNKQSDVPLVQIESVTVPTKATINRIFGVGASQFVTNWVKIKGKTLTGSTFNFYTVREALPLFKTKVLGRNYVNILNKALLSNKKLLSGVLSKSALKLGIKSSLLMASLTSMDINRALAYMSMLALSVKSSSMLKSKQLLDQAQKIAKSGKVVSKLKKTSPKKRIRKTTKRIIKPTIRTPPKLPPKLPPKIRPQKIPPPKDPPNKPIQWNKEELTKRYKKFDVYVKKKGAKTPYTRINRGWLTFTHARNLGRYITDHTPLASYQIRPTSVGGKQQKFSVRVPDKKFRRVKAKSRLPRKTVVERRKYRLDTIGEKRGISVKALKKLRSQRDILRLLKGRKGKKTHKLRKRRRLSKPLNRKRK